jgi:CelD/BcsL family acetyltransferase involved in cellulose biosynthesis
MISQRTDPDGTRVRVWDEAEWLQSKVLLDDLLSRSRADPLFSSWDWQTLWWNHSSRTAGDERLQVHAVYDGAGLIGVLVIVIATVRRRGLRYRSAQALGNRMREAVPIVSEFLDVIAVAGREQEVRAAALESVLRQERCGEFTVGWCAEGAAWQELIDARPGRWLRYLRMVDPLISYEANLADGFAAYLASLSGNARRSLFNLRRKLSDQGTVSVAAVPPGEHRLALAEMTRLHALRWGGPPFSPAGLRMQQDLIERWSDAGRICLSVLKVDDRTVSVLYDIRIGHVQYNMQMGFDPGFSSSLSIGLLHLGYAMEQAADDGVLTYNFLAGTGRETDYKKRIASRQVELISIQYLQDPVVASMFRMYDRLNDWRGRIGVG